MPVPHTSPRIQRSLLRQDVYVYLRGEILSGTIRPGALLHEAEIERATGASRTPVREAINRLRADGFVDVQPQRETRVRKIDPLALSGALHVLEHMIRHVIPKVVGSISERELVMARGYRDAVVADPEAEVDLLGRGEAFAGISGMLLRAFGNHTMLRAARAIDLHVRWAVAADRRLARLLVAGPADVALFVEACERRDPVAALDCLSRYCAGSVEPYLAALRREALQPDSVCEDRAPNRRLGAQRGLLRDQVYEALLDAIARGQFSPGERLREDELMEWLGVSRSPLRDALIRLESVGLVESLPGRFTRVTVLDVAALADTFRAMAVFASLSMAEGVPRLGPAEIGSLDASLLRLSAAVKQNETAEVLLATNEFVHTITCASGNQTLEIIEQRVVPRLFKRVELDPPIDLALLEAEVRAIRLAIEHGDPVAAGVAVRELYAPAALAVTSMQSRWESAVPARG